MVLVCLLLLSHGGEDTGEVGKFWVICFACALGFQISPFLFFYFINNRGGGGVDLLGEGKLT